MFVRSFAAIVLVLPALAGAISVLHNNNAITGTGTNGVRPTTGNGAPTTINQCNTGTLQCCDQVQSADSSDVSTFLGLIGAVVGGPDTLVGFSCTPINVGVIAGGTSCTAQPVCCTNNDFDGVVAVGCQPVNLVPRGLDVVDLFDTAPVDFENLAIDFENLPINFADLPLDVGELPVDAEKLPVDAEALPVDTEAMPVDMEALPVDMEAMPVDMEALPVDMEALPVDAEALPMDPLSIL